MVRLPRHGASCPVAIAVSCSADRQALGKITAEGVFLEQLETDPAQYMPDGRRLRRDRRRRGRARSTSTSRWTRSSPSSRKHPVKTRLSLTGPLVVARDIAHAKIKERLDAGEEMPSYLRDHPVYYAGPAKTPEGMASGSFGPTTAGRMDSYVEQFQAAGGSKVMLAKGNRSKVVTEACHTHGGFYLGSIGGPAARLAQDCITSVSVLEYEELGMEAVWKIEVEDFPAFIVVDDKGNDFFTDPSGAVTVPLVVARDPGALGGVALLLPLRPGRRSRPTRGCAGALGRCPGRPTRGSPGRRTLPGTSDEVAVRATTPSDVPHHVRRCGRRGVGRTAYRRADVTPTRRGEDNRGT